MLLLFKNFYSYYNAPGLFVDFFPMQIDATARYAATRSMTAQWSPGRAPREPLCDYILALWPRR